MAYETEIAKRLQLIEEIKDLNKMLVESPDQREIIYRSGYIDGLMRRIMESNLNNEDLLPEDAEVVNKRIERYLTVPRNEREHYDLVKMMDVIVQVMRVEHIPSDLKRLEEIESKYFNDYLGAKGGQDANSAGGGLSGGKGSGGIERQANEVYGSPHLINSTYSFADTLITINIPGRGPVVVGDVSDMGYSILREKSSVTTLGKNTSRGYSYGNRYVTGSLVLSVFNHSVVYNIMEEYYGAGYPILMDELPLFNIEMVMSNEYGQRSRMTIYGVTIVREAMVIGIHDLHIQNAYDFIAKDIMPIESANNGLGFSSTHVPFDDRDIVPRTYQINNRGTAVIPKERSLLR